MNVMHQLLTGHIDIWTAAETEKKSGRGRAAGNAGSVYGIKKLRELILELAVRGKLVPQDASDEPAGELLKRIQAEKANLVAEGKIRKGQPLPAITDQEKPFDLPSGWDWVRLGLIGDWGAGATPLRSVSNYYGGEIPWFKSGELTADFIDTSEETITGLALKECSLRLNQPGDVLIAMYGATIGKTAILKVLGTTNQAVCACTPNTGIFNRYLLILLKAMKSNFIGQGTGGAQPNISREKIIATVVCIPSTEEQHRIVAKVDELMALCDQLETRHSNAADAHEKLVSHLLGTLTQSQKAADFSANWQRIAAHFDTLFTTKASIDALKKTLLQLAVMGKLVPQDPNDEPARELLTRIHIEKRRLVSEGKIKKDKPLTLVEEKEKLFLLPLGWEWIGLGDYSQEIATGPFGSMIHQSDYVQGGVPLINPSHMIDDKIVADESVSVSKLTAKALESYVLNDGDIVMARRGEVGRIALVTKNESGYLCGTGSFILKFNPEICRSYLKLFFKSNYSRTYLAGESVGTTMVNLNHGILRKMPLALPPLAEQRRIVAKVFELMEICNQLKSRITNANQLQQKLADVLVEKAVA